MDFTTILVLLKVLHQVMTRVISYSSHDLMTVDSDSLFKNVREES